MRPFLKWLGNKYRYLDKIQTLLPEGKRLIEPFAGSGALFLNSNYPKYILGEQNQDLVNLYQCLQKEGEEFISLCKSYFISKNNEKTRYYRFREKFNGSDCKFERASLFLYLNRHGYNGLCRYNRQGVFNVPFGLYEKPYFPEKEMIFFHQKAQNAIFHHADYRKTMNKLRKGDVVYCDPPYVPLSDSANFTAYTSQAFGEEEQETLSNLAKTLALQGIPVLISNHDTKVTRTLYKSAKLQSFKMNRHVSCKGDKRKPVKEILALFDGT